LADQPQAEIGISRNKIVPTVPPLSFDFAQDRGSVQDVYRRESVPDVPKVPIVPIVAEYGSSDAIYQEFCSFAWDEDLEAS
jgi:hypothetical protein